MNRSDIGCYKQAIECYKQALEGARAELMALGRSSLSLAIERTPDPMEALVFASNRDMAFEMLDRRAVLLQQVANALERIRTGEYSVCLECQGPISEKRLDAVPWADLCLKCQEAQDRGLRPSGESGLRVRLSGAA